MLREIFVTCIRSGDRRSTGIAHFMGTLKNALPDFATYFDTACEGRSADMGAERGVEITTNGFLSIELLFSPGRCASRDRRHASELSRLDVAAEFAGQVGQADPGADAGQPDVFEFRTAHTVLDIAEDVLDQTADPRLLAIVRLLRLAEVRAARVFFVDVVVHA